MISHFNTNTPATHSLRNCGIQGVVGWKLGGVFFAIKIEACNGICSPGEPKVTPVYHPECKKISSGQREVNRAATNACTAREMAREGAHEGMSTNEPGEGFETGAALPVDPVFPFTEHRNAPATSLHEIEVLLLLASKESGGQQPEGIVLAGVHSPASSNLAHTARSLCSRGGTTDLGMRPDYASKGYRCFLRVGFAAFSVHSLSFSYQHPIPPPQSPGNSEDRRVQTQDEPTHSNSQPNYSTAAWTNTAELP
ncbi:hypothetical protein D9611_006652 [Ephemerocybe angulata]|uniref:Uncharacterized protein n=1 Tax=Ephemerocybe angulata TaxID=980116 RepID=A0A8H5C848_9AGAR|nr:hypothetical protein D9611_006652 [Tulosesus angulatus]